MKLTIYLYWIEVLWSIDVLCKDMCKFPLIEQRLWPLPSEHIESSSNVFPKVSEFSEQA